MIRAASTRDTDVAAAESPRLSATKASADTAHAAMTPARRTGVGSYSVPEWLERLKTDYYQRRISSAYLQDIHEVVIKAALKDQEKAGVDIVSDGELRSGIRQCLPGDGPFRRVGQQGSLGHSSGLGCNCDRRDSRRLGNHSCMGNELSGRLSRRVGHTLRMGYEYRGRDGNGCDRGQRRELT